MTEPTTTTATAGRGSVPEANRPVVEGELRRALRYAAKRRERYGPPAGAENVLLLRAAPEWRAQPEFTVLGDHRLGTGPVTVTVRGCATVLAVLDALSEPRDPESYLVILTPRENRELGNSVLAQVLGNEVRPINRWDLVAEAFGARRLDPRLDGKRYRWLAEALLEAQPGSGWKRINGPVLQLDAALRRLTAVRFAKNPERDGEERLDAAALLEWSRDETRLARFLGLRDEERKGLIGWLEESIGPVAQVVFRLLRSGQAADAIPFGLAAAELYAPAAKRRKVVTEARIRAEERFLGGQAPAEPSLWAFAEAAESLVLRCGDTGHAPATKDLRDRAEQILAELGAGDLAGASKILDAGLDARLAALAAEITAVLPVLAAAGLGPLEEALDRLWDHRRCGERSGEVEAAVCAVRLVRWLAEREEAPATVAEGAFRQVRSWGWADRATAVIFNADTVRVPSARAAYQQLFGSVRARRAELDRAFADRLAGWSPVAGPTGDLLLAENLLERVARPIAERGAPLIIVLDGMSTAAACALAEEIAATRTWTEVGRSAEGREPALSTIPSATAFSRTSLLSGALKAGGQAEERAGFAAFWRGRRTALFHKAGLGGGAGVVLADELLAALQDPGTVVGAVLNTIDDALRDDLRVNAPTWRLNEIDYLEQLLTAAATVQRPVILTSDHGHVLEYGSDIHPAKGDAARYRSGEPGDGELLLTGPRVLATGGSVTVPWDERIRYLPRKAGYHGGISLAEMVIPVLVLIPAGSTPPKGWAEYENASLHEPSWWTADPAAPAPSTPAAAPAKRRGRKSAVAQDETLFPVGDAQSAGDAGSSGEAERPGGLGALIVASELYAAQRTFVRKAPDGPVVAALIDGLDAAGGKLPMASAARLTGQPPFRMAGYLATVGRLLNVDGYQVIAESDGGRTVELDLRLLRLQFLGES